MMLVTPSRDYDLPRATHWVLDMIIPPGMHDGCSRLSSSGCSLLDSLQCYGSLTVDMKGKGILVIHSGA